MSAAGNGVPAVEGAAIWGRLERLLHREGHAVLMGHRDLLALASDERVERGECLAGLGWRGEAPPGTLNLRCQVNLSKWRRGDSLTLRSQDDDRGIAVLYEGFDAAKRVLIVRRDPYRGRGEVDETVPLQLDPTPVTLHTMALEAIGELRQRRDGAAEAIRAIFELRARPTIADADERFARRCLAGDALRTLDDSQKEAFIAAVTKRPVALIQGPPGSGKTYLLAQVVSALAHRGERILITAYTHRAVNNALRKLAEVDPRCDAIKVGQVHAADDLEGTPVASVRRAGELRPPTPGRPQVIGATLFALRGFAGKRDFDRVVFDEAAQVPLAFAPCGMAAGSRFLFVGDHRQMGPIVQGNHDDAFARTSVFEYLSAAFEPALLRVTYRMNDGINAFPSKAFYGEQLQPHPTVGRRRFARIEGGEFDAVLDPELPAVLATIHHEGFRTRSAPEAHAVAALAVEMLTRQRLRPNDLAVVAPYRQQIREIRTRLQAALAPLGIPLPVVDTVERIQGQEREAVIVSLTASDPEYLALEQAAFFFSPNRLNVTLTRARTKLVIFASGHLFRALPSSFEDLKNADLFKRLYRELPRVDLTGRY